MGFSNSIRTFQVGVSSAPEVSVDGLSQSFWVDLPQDILREVLFRIEASELASRYRSSLVSCAGVCRSWRMVTMEIVNTPRFTAKLSFPISVKQVYLSLSLSLPPLLRIWYFLFSWFYSIFCYDGWLGGEILLLGLSFFVNLDECNFVIVEYFNCFWCDWNMWFETKEEWVFRITLICLYWCIYWIALCRRFYFFVIYVVRLSLYMWKTYTICKKLFIDFGVCPHQKNIRLVQ